MTFDDSPETQGVSAAVLDCDAWKAMLDREGVAAAGAYIGIVTREDYAARRGSVLVWRGAGDGARAEIREYDGQLGSDVAMLLVADPEALGALLAGGLAEVPHLVRRGTLHPYMLMTLDDLDAVGLADFVEDFGLVFPRH